MNDCELLIPGTEKFYDAILSAEQAHSQVLSVVPGCSLVEFIHHPFGRGIDEG